MRDYVSGNSIYSVDGRLYYSKDKDGGYYYDNLKYTKIATEYVGIEGGGGYYDANSGGYDVLGLGTLMYAR